MPELDNGSLDNVRDVAWEARDIAAEARAAVERFELRIMRLEDAIKAYAIDARVGPHSAQNALLEVLSR